MEKQGAHLLQANHHRNIFSVPGFRPYVFSQFLGALNDNLFKTLLSFMAIHLSDQITGSSFLWWVQCAFVLPLIFLSTLSGYWADRYQKNEVMFRCKVIEVISLLVGALFFWHFNPYAILFVFLIISIRSVVFSPSKYAIIPEFFPPEELSWVNGWIEMSTFVSIVLGSALAAFLYQNYQEQPILLNIALLTVAIFGLFFSRQVPAVSRKQEQAPAPFHFFSDLKLSFRDCIATKGLVSAILGLSSFYAIGLVFQPSLLFFADQVLNLNYFEQGLLLTFFGLMVGLGSLLAGFWSGAKIEYGLIPFGALGLAMGVFYLAYATDVWDAILSLMLLGLSSGCFIVPLHALIQLLPSDGQRGRIIAFNNMIQGVFMLLVVLMFWLASSLLNLNAKETLLLLGVLGSFLAVMTLFEEPRFLIRFLVHLFVRLFYRLRVVGESHLPLKGGALIVCNHVTFIDGLVLASVFQRFLRFLIHRKYYMYFKPIMNYCYGIPIESGNPQLIAESIQRARQQLLDGHVICIFAEGALTRTGNLLRFKTGFERIVEGLDVPIIPVHLDQLWGSFFSHRDGKLFKKMPEFRRSELIVSIGSPLPSDTKAWDVRLAIQSLGADARMQAKKDHRLLSRQFWSMARKKYFKKAMFEENKKIDYANLMIQAWRLSVDFKKKYHFEKTERVGLFIDRSSLCSCVVLALTLGGHSIVMLPKIQKANWRFWMKHFDLKHIVTTQELFEQYHLPEELTAACVFLEGDECFKTHSYFKKLYYRFCPISLPGDPEKEHVIVPLPQEIEGGLESEKLNWVVLSHSNISSAIQSLHQVFTVKDRDRLLAVLPTDYAFGYVGNIWFPLLVGLGTIFPHWRDAGWSEIGNMAHRHRATFLIDVPDAYEQYLMHFSREVFAHLKYAIVGGKTIRQSLFQDFEDKFNIPLLEGFGLSECSGVISVNVPNIQLPDQLQRAHKTGSAGQLLPGMGARIVDPLTFEPRKPGEMGILWIKGLSLMRGYYQVEAPIVFKKDGRWFNTGISASMDEEGFLFFPG